MVNFCELNREIVPKTSLSSVFYGKGGINFHVAKNLGENVHKAMS